MYTLFKRLCAAAFLGKFTFSNQFSCFDDWHAVNKRNYIVFCDPPVSVKVVNVKNKLNFLIIRGAVYVEQALKELLL